MPEYTNKDMATCMCVDVISTFHNRLSQHKGEGVKQNLVVTLVLRHYFLSHYFQAHYFLGHYFQIPLVPTFLLPKPITSNFLKLGLYKQPNLTLFAAGVT